MFTIGKETRPNAQHPEGRGERDDFVFRRIVKNFHYQQGTGKMNTGKDGAKMKKKKPSGGTNMEKPQSPYMKAPPPPQKHQTPPKNG